jgi:hypothetical protein
MISAFLRVLGKINHRVETGRAVTRSGISPFGSRPDRAETPLRTRSVERTRGVSSHGGSLKDFVKKLSLAVSSALVATKFSYLGQAKSAHGASLGHRDIRKMPNGYGTLGICLKLEIRSPQRLPVEALFKNLRCILAVASRRWMVLSGSISPSQSTALFIIG